MASKFGLRFGALSPLIKAQLDQQGLLYEKDEVHHFQKDADAINRLRIRGYIPDSQLNKIHQKLMKKIGSHVTAP
jgi:hypothetical protein